MSFLQILISTSDNPLPLSFNRFTLYPDVVLTPNYFSRPQTSNGDCDERGKQLNNLYF